ncbi:hypothetical protein TNCV_4291 [Trichonephila clavipes]|nr:hypothetical protein TNCV_4291 [Trichonephila clavipes]
MKRMIENLFAVIKSLRSNALLTPENRAHPKGLELHPTLLVQTRGMSNSPSQIKPDMLYWRQIWGSGRPTKGSNSAETVS